MCVKVFFLECWHISPSFYYFYSGMQILSGQYPGMSVGLKGVKSLPLSGAIHHLQLPRHFCCAITLSPFASALCSERLNSAEMSKYSWIIVSQQDDQETSAKEMRFKICLKRGIDFPMVKQNSPNQKHGQGPIFARVSLCHVERSDQNQRHRCQVVMVTQAVPFALMQYIL